ncbi:MAG: pectate lyase [Prevotella sp.]|nr:pectate lyase [Prevotella sp.]
MKYLTKALTLLSVVTLLACGGGDDSTSSDGGGDSGGGNGSLPIRGKNRSLAFPGADGGAKTITGGAEGEVYIVTNLKDSGDGSLRRALDGSNRTIVFAVAGQINLESTLTINKQNITIAGQTAPGDGITIAGYPVYIGSSAKNIILRFLRFRMGDQNIDKVNFNADDGDALGGKDCQQIMIDHCSISYSTDECASFSRISDFTLQYCIISESMKLSGHSKGNHGYGGIWGGRNASYHHNLLAHHDSRNPRFDHSYVGKGWRGPIDYVNNVVYNWGSNSTYGGETDSETDVFHINMIGNYYKKGPSSKVANRLMQLTSHCTNCVKTSGDAYPAKIYLEGNLINGSNATWDNIDMDGSSETRDKTTLKESAYLEKRYTEGLTAVISPEPAATAYNTVLQFAGASKNRDAIDERIVKEVKEGTGAIIDKVSDNMAKYFPTLNVGTSINDTDKDGMPDDWEIEQMAKLGVTGLSVDKFSPSSYNLSSRYTNLEVYMNELVTHTFPSGAGASNTR